MKPYMLPIAGAAAAGYALADLLYPMGMNLGPLTIDSEWVRMILPLLAAIIVPLVKAKSPWLGALLEKLLPKPTATDAAREETLARLVALDRMELESCGCADTLKACELARRREIARYHGATTPPLEG